MSESLMLLFMLSTAITLLLIYFRLREIDHNAAEHTRLIRHDIIEREGYISAAIGERAVQISNMEKNLTTEIACLATKNNEDIKRMGGKFEEWDLINLDENEVLIYSAKPNANGQMVFHCVDKAGKTYTFFGSDKLNDAKFLRHTSSPFGEREV